MLPTPGRKFCIVREGDYVVFERIYFTTSSHACTGVIFLLNFKEDDKRWQKQRNSHPAPGDVRYMIIQMRRGSGTINDSRLVIHVRQDEGKPNGWGLYGRQRRKFPVNVMQH